MGPYDFFLPPIFEPLPEAVTDRLLLGCIGRKQAAQTGLVALRTTDRSVPLAKRLGLELPLLAFDLDPLNAELARAILAMNPPLPESDKQALLLAAEADWTAPWRTALTEAEQRGDWIGFLHHWDTSWTAAGAPLTGRVLGIAAVASGDTARIEAWHAGLDAATATPGLHWLAVQAALRLEGRQAGIRALQAYLGRWPWNISALLTLYDQAQHCDSALEELPGDMAILLYSFNKADDLARTLEDLLASRLGPHRIFVLDNGSTDATPDVLASFRGRFGQDRFTALRAPVNVGAPAGRNWLRALPEVRKAAYIAYLDDDLRLPRDWALRLGAAVAAHPQAGVYGCRITDAGAPSVLQATEFQLAPGEPGTPFAATDLQLQAPDLGQFNYCRPALSVTGCCHLFTADALERVGDFDIRFSPSQFDDFDHDLRAALGGHFAVYQGHLAVGHKRRSGGDTRRERLAGANAHGNMLKLQGKYDAGEIRRLRREQRAKLLTDIRKKAIWLSRHADPDPAARKE